MEEIIIEKVTKYKFVKIGYEPDGHDCWWNNEYCSYKYVIINGKEEKCYNDWYVVHDEKNVKEIITEFIKDVKYKSLLTKRKDKINKIIQRIKNYSK
jgi:hypothetical protein